MMFTYDWVWGGRDTAFFYVKKFLYMMLVDSVWC